MKSKKFLAALAALTAVSAVATTGLTAKADEEVVYEVAPEAVAPVVEAPAPVAAPAPAPVAPVVSEPTVVEPSTPAPTVVTVDETPAAQEAPAVDTSAAATDATAAPAADATATDAAVADDATAATEAVDEAVAKEAIPDADTGWIGDTANPNWSGYSTDDTKGYTPQQLAEMAKKAETSVEKNAAVDYKKIYQKYVDETLIKDIEGGQAALTPDKTNPSKDYVRKEMLGLVTVQVHDFGNDGIEELVAVTREQVRTEDKNKGAADFMLNLFQYDRASDSTKLVGRQTLGTYDLTYAGFARIDDSNDGANTSTLNGGSFNTAYMGDRAYTDSNMMKGENDSTFQLSIIGDSIYFVQEQLTDIATELNDKDPNANRITHKIFQVDTRKNVDFGTPKDAVYGKDVVGGAIANPYILNINKTTATEYLPTPKTNGIGAVDPDEMFVKGTSTIDAEAAKYTGNLLYVNETRYQKITGQTYNAALYGTPQFKDELAATTQIRKQFDTMKVPVNYLYLVDDVYDKDSIYLDVRFAQRDVDMLMQYNTSPNFTTIDFTGNRGNAHPAGTSEKKSGSSSNGGSSNGGATTSSPNTGDSRVPVAAGAAAVAAAAAAVAFVSKKRG